MKKTIKAIIFDVNGTLFDDTEMFWNVINDMLERYGKKRLPLDKFRQQFGQPWTKIFRDQGIAESTASDGELYIIYNELYTKYGEESPPQPFEGEKETLQWLWDKEIKLGIVSTQQNKITVPMLEKFGLRDFFSHLESGVSDKTQGILNAIEALRFEPDEAIYIGDQQADVEHAQAAGCLVLAFTGGLHTEEMLMKKNPDGFLGAFPNLKEMIIL